MGMIFYIFIGILTLIIMSFLAKEIKLQFDVSDQIAWSVLVGLTTAVYMSWANSLEEFQVWLVVLIIYFIILILLSYYGVLFRR